MDRAAFLRALDFLRPLPPGAWASSNDEEEPHSGSTITPPTPSKNNLTMLFEESLFAVSLEPNISPDERIRAITQPCSRKRSRVEDLPTTASQNCFAVGPAFFQSDVAEAKKHSANSASKTSEVDDTMDVEPENDAQRVIEDKGADLKRQINSDPSICVFEAAVLKQLPSSILGDDPPHNSVFSVPNKHRHGTSNEKDLIESKALIFRLGNRFVFQVDESAILELKYEPGHNEGVLGTDSSHANTDSKTNAPQMSNGKPLSKRQRNGEEIASHRDETSAQTKNFPPSLTFAFGSCTFRIFSLESDESSNDLVLNKETPTDRIWCTLAKTVQSVESRLMRARTILMQQFEIENSEKKRRQIVSLSWKMAPPGSGLAFSSWPELYEQSSFHSNTLKCAGSTFLEENWAHCLDNKGTIPSTISSPQKSSSTSKTSSSSTCVEHGQKDPSPTKDASPSGIGVDVDKNDNDEKTDVPRHLSELTHESHQNIKEDGAKKSNENQTSICEDLGRNGKNAKTIDEEDVINGNQSHEADTSLLGDAKKKTAQDGIDPEEGNPNQHSWKEEIYRKYNDSEKSAVQMDKALESASLQKNGTTSHLTSCAESLSNSFLTMNEFMNSSQRCENVIAKVMSDMERVLEKMFPARVTRGRKSYAVASDQSENFQSTMEELMASRKEAVAAKLALLMTPKR